MTTLSQVFIVLVVLVAGFKIYLNYRQMSAIKAHQDHVPNSFSNTVTLIEHQKAAKYNLAKLRLAQIEEVFSSVMLLIFTIGGGIQLINQLFSNLSYSTISYGVVVIASYGLINAIIGIPFSLYATFNIEQRFGFNKTTVKLFIFDLSKNTILSAVIGIPLLYLILWLMQSIGSTWWLWVWGVLVVFNLLILVIYPTFIAPLFNKFTPLADDALKERISHLLSKCGFTARGVFVMDGSKRSSHGNAYFTGLGKAKRIVFFDTLLNQLSTDEIEAVLAHELGHFKKKHVLQQMIVSFASTLLILWILSYLIALPVFYTSLGVSNITTYNALILFSILLGLFALPFAPLFSYLSRRNEFAADKFATTQTNSTSLISGLVKLYRDNASTLTPDWLYVKFHYSHPPASERIEEISHAQISATKTL